MAMDGYISFFRGKLENAHHVQQSAYSGDPVIVPTKIVVENPIVHEQLRVVGKA